MWTKAWVFFSLDYVPSCFSRRRGIITQFQCEYAYLITTNRNSICTHFCFGTTSTFGYWYQYIQRSPIQTLSHPPQCFICSAFCFEKRCRGKNVSILVDMDMTHLQGMCTSHCQGTFAVLCLQCILNVWFPLFTTKWKWIIERRCRRSSAWPSYREDATKEKAERGRQSKTIIGDRKYHQLEVSDPKSDRLLNQFSDCQVHLSRGHFVNQNLHRLLPNWWRL